MTSTAKPAVDTPPARSDLTRVFGRIGILSFGGPAAQIALMHRELVDERPWLSEEQFLRALSFCMLLPGPEAMQLATYCGWRLHGVAGGLIAGGLFVLPGAVVMLALSLLYAYLGNVPLVQAMFLGIKAAVVVIVIEALVKVARKALRLPDHWIIAALSFIAIFFFAVPFPIIILTAAIWGALRTPVSTPPTTPTEAAPMSRTVRTVAFWGALWAAPLVLLWLTDRSFLLQIGLFFSQLAVVTFGGAYAVLAYMTQAVVQEFGWLTTAEMMDGLGLAETTPGPLILVTEFVGFLAGFRTEGLGTALLAALLTLWVTFVPCFLWIFVGAPYIDWLCSRPRLAGALQGITAAVVGVILNLSVWFATHVFFDEVSDISRGAIRTIAPDLTTLNLSAVLLAALSAFLILRLRWALPRALGTVAVLGAILSPWI